MTKMKNILCLNKIAKVGTDKLNKAEYNVGALLLDKDNPLKVIARTSDPILSPEHPYETDGFYCRCIFPCGNVVVDGTLYVYYGAADRYVGVATCSLRQLLDYLKSECLC